MPWTRNQSQWYRAFKECLLEGRAWKALPPAFYR